MDADLVLALAAAIDQRYSCPVLLAGFGGLRLGELLALRRHHVDPDRHTVTVTVQTVELKSGERLTTAPKTDAGRRVVHLPAQVTAALAVHLDRYVGPEGDALVFTGPRSDGLRRATFYTEWDRARSRTGLDHVHLHDLRHAAGTLAAQTGATTREVMARLGHATPAASHRYQHAAARTRRPHRRRPRRHSRSGRRSVAAPQAGRMRGAGLRRAGAARRHHRTKGL